MATYKYEFEFANSLNRFDPEEFHMYGNSRIDTIPLGVPLYENGSPKPNWTEPVTNLRVGHKRYELTNHGSATLTTSLCNVMAVVNDRTQGIHADADGIIDYYEATVLKANDYYPFGSLMPGREYSAGDYRFGYNTQEKVDEISGSGNHYTAQFWEYDPRIVTRWNRDPVTFPWQSPYAINNNNPIVFTDPFGLFGSRKEAREYKKEHGLKGRIKEGDDGIFYINNKKGGASYYRDHSLDDIPNVLGRQDDGVIKSGLVSADESGPSTGAFVDGLEEYGKRGCFDLRKKHINKYAYESTKYLKQEFGIKLKPRDVTNRVVKSNKWITKTLAKRAPFVGGVLDAYEVYEGIQADGNALGANTAIEVAGVVDGAGGAWGGATLGAMAGTVLIPIPGVGTVIGATVGAIMGSCGGEEGVELFMKKLTKEE